MLDMAGSLWVGYSGKAVLIGVRVAASVDFVFDGKSADAPLVNGLELESDDDGGLFARLKG